MKPTSEICFDVSGAAGAAGAAVNGLKPAGTLGAGATGCGAKGLKPDGSDRLRREGTDGEGDGLRWRRHARHGHRMLRAIMFDPVKVVRGGEGKCKEDHLAIP